MEEKELPISIQRFIVKMCELASGHPQWAKVFRNCFSDTLLHTVKFKEDGTTYVLTGDIPAMWLRDSTAQIRPYLVLAREDENIRGLIAGVIERQFRYINIDPYANAFNEMPNGQGHQKDQTDMGPWIWERKYEIDSLCYPIQLSYLLWKYSGRTDHFNSEFHSGILKILDLWETEVDHSQSSYRFERADCPESDTLKNGIGTPIAVTGMIWSGFRPSDDCCQYHYMIPANMFAVVVLKYLEEIYQMFESEPQLKDRIVRLRTSIELGIKKYGIIKNRQGEEIFAYEVDGLGNHIFMDDANVPSLLAAPYLGYCNYQNPIYIHTRTTVLSQENPCYYEGSCVSGIGSCHTPEKYIWPIALAIQGLTSPDKNEKERILDLLCRIDGGTGQMHESVDVNNPLNYTREWFSWANMMFCELMMDYYDIFRNSFQ